MSATIVSVSMSPAHSFSKPVVPSIELVGKWFTVGPGDIGENVGAAGLDRAATGALVRKAGVMSVVLEGGTVHAGDTIRVSLPAPPHRALERV